MQRKGNIVWGRLMAVHACGMREAMQCAIWKLACTLNMQSLMNTYGLLVLMADPTNRLDKVKVDVAKLTDAACNIN